jgi:large subunit ribosomal protein L13
VDTLSYKTVSSNKATANKQWLIVDAADQTLGRFSSKVAQLLRGKHKPSFSPHVDCGDNIIVINADKIRLTGKKWSDKVYIRHTGYPGGQRFINAKDLMTKHPMALVEKAVRGMLPKNRLGDAIYKNLHVYVGTEHPHTAQQPKEFNISTIK